MATTTKAPVTAKAISATDVKAFVKAYRTGEQSVVNKARLVGKARLSGQTIGKITETYRDALVADGLIVPKSFSASITHYSTAHTAASTLDMASNDAVLHALYQISTGVIKAAEREAFVTFHADKGSTPEEVVSSVRALIAKARKAKAAAKAETAPVESPVESDDEPEVGPSPLDDLAAILKRAGATLDVLSDNSPEDDYPTALAMIAEFVARYVSEVE